MLDSVIDNTQCKGVAVSADALATVLSGIKSVVRTYPDRFTRARRLFVEERCAALASERETEFEIKRRVSDLFEVAYTSVFFAGSAQLGFSVHKDQLFKRAESDLDVACVDVGLFQRAWMDAVSVTRAFTDLTPFSGHSPGDIEYFKSALLRRGMIKVSAMPSSDLSRRWRSFEDELSRTHSSIFSRINFAIYMNEYAFCWKQDSSLTAIMRK